MTAWTDRSASLSFRRRLGSGGFRATFLFKDGGRGEVARRLRRGKDWFLRRVCAGIEWISFGTSGGTQPGEDSTGVAGHNKRPDRKSGNECES